MLCCFHANAQFEGEYTTKSYVAVKVKGSGVLGRLAAGIGNSMTKKRLNKGVYTTKVVTKGNKTRTESPLDHKVEIYIVEEDYTELITYYTDIKKGYKMTNPIGASRKKNAASNVLKTGTMVVDGHNCDVYKLTVISAKDEDDGYSEVINYECAIDPSIQMSDDKIIPGSGLTGFPFKYIQNVDTKHSEIESHQTVSTMAVSVVARTVDDSEFEVPAGITMVRIMDMNKVWREHNKYMEKNAPAEDDEQPADEEKVYDDLEGDWDF